MDLRNRLRTEKYCNAGHSHQGSSNPKILQRKGPQILPGVRVWGRRNAVFDRSRDGGSQEAATFSTKTENYTDREYEGRIS